jgi:hypothetical protein
MRTMSETRLECMRRNTARGLRPGARGLALRCTSGLLVVTQKGDREDHELRPGDEFQTARRGRVVVWALPDSAFAVRSIGVFPPRLRAA